MKVLLGHVSAVRHQSLGVFSMDMPGVSVRDQYKAEAG
jgi:hypothetical protein